MQKKFFSSFLCFAFMFIMFAEVFSSSNFSGVEATKVYNTPYYYNQLTDNAKMTYKTLKKAIINCDEIVKIRYDIDQNDFKQIAELLIFHDPVTFNLKNIEVSSSFTSIYFKLSYRYDKDEYDKMVLAYNEEVNEILDNLTDDMSTYKKIRVIHDSIINSTEYDLDSETNDTIYGTLVNKKGKCDGYSKSFSYICGLAGIRTITVIGDDKMDDSGLMHMWNKVYYNKKWYNVDVTWDDPVSNLKNNLQYDFFMVSDDALKNTHNENNFSFSVPAAEDDSKNYFVINKKYAEDLSSAKRILRSGLTSASEKEKSCVVLKCSSKSVYEEIKNYVLDTDKISAILRNVSKKTNSKLISDIYSYKFNDNQYIVSLYIFYKNSDLDDYFTSTDRFNSYTLEVLSQYGID